MMYIYKTNYTNYTNYTTYIGKIKMEAYYCKQCKYLTSKLQHFKDHCESKKHNAYININKIEINNQTDFHQFKKKVFSCDECDTIYMSNRSLQKHQIKCLEKMEANMLNNEIKELKKELKNKDAQLNKALDIAHDNSKTANASMNMLRYAKLYLNDVEPLKQLEKEDTHDIINYNNPKGKESKNEEYVKIAIHKFTHGFFSNFIGDMIIEHYKPTTKKDTNIISTDTSRLCFIIMQKVKKRGKIEKKEWINDKSGKKFTELILIPIITAVKETLVEFIEFKKTKELNENNLCLMGKCVELKRDIEVGKFTKPILRYVAPNFHFDKLKFLDVNDEENDNLLFISDDEKPKKIIIKKRNKKSESE